MTADDLTITLRAVEPGDVDMMFNAENDRSAWFASDITAPMSRQLLMRYAMNYDADPWRHEQLRLIATLTHTGEPVGIADFYELSQRHRRGFAGIYIMPQYRGRGMGRKMLAEMNAYARDVLMLNQLAARISTLNPTACQVFENAGYVKSGVMRAWHLAMGQNHDIALYQILFR